MYGTPIFKWFYSLNLIAAIFTGLLPSSSFKMAIFPLSLAATPGISLDFYP